MKEMREKETAAVAETDRAQIEAELGKNPELAARVRHQMRVIRQGAEELIGAEELERKIARSILTGRPLIVKFGMDPSAPDIHLGHAVPLRKLRQMQDMGHTIVIVIGDFTAKIGDPTGKSKGRKAMTEQEVFVNAQTYQEQIFRILDREKTRVHFNGEWLELLNLNEVLQLASTVTVARMLERDDFQNRFRSGVPIGLHEFFYPLMQAYDSVELGADLELGGTDQTFNILMGRQLQRDKEQEPQAALFMPLLEGTDGTEKMSKSLGNYIGISEDARTMFTKVMRRSSTRLRRIWRTAATPGTASWFWPEPLQPSITARRIRRKRSSFSGRLLPKRKYRIRRRYWRWYWRAEPCSTASAPWSMQELWKAEPSSGG